MKKVECEFCGKKFHRNGIGPHMKHCEQRMVDGTQPKRKYKKRKGTPAGKVLFEQTNSHHVVFATLQVEIDMVKGIELGVVKFVAKD